mmetsp:Transcript_23586/g.54878  ORF Transcript_23586/g.54878 Transcript_23586/m.54878 type:complete len:110 (-) Transcript_23586:1660-1989(-)
MANATHKSVNAVIFDLDGTLLDTEALSDKAIIKAFGDSLPENIRAELREGGDRLPWEIKSQLLGKRGDEWTPLAIRYAQEKWGVSSFKEGESSALPPPPSVYVHITSKT